MRDRTGVAIEPTGVLLIDKPEGPTSHDVVRAARRALRTRRVGHAGTLDPFATGLLLLCVGSATRLAEYASSLDKGYVATMRLGAATSTDDLTGEVTAASESWRDVERDDVERVLRALDGDQMQLPPAFSAKKVGGERSYRLARRGQAVALTPVRISIRHIAVIDFAPPDTVFEVVCSSGTYIRSIARDAGAALGCYAHLRGLRRTAIGSFSVKDALALADLNAESARDSLLPSAAAVAHLPHIELPADDAQRLALGQRLLARNSAVSDADAAAAVHDGRLIAVVEIRGGVVRPRKVLAHA
jgi:tRNA pseudouridine55 synthase